MNFVQNLKSTQWRKLFKIFKCSGIQSFNIFGARECFLFEFTNLSGVWKFENSLTGRAHMLAARFHLTSRDGHPVPRATLVPGGCAHRTESARCRWPPVVAAPLGLAPLTTTPDITEEATTHLAFPLCPFGHARCYAPHRPPLHPPSPIVDKPPPSCQTSPKGAPHPHAPPAPRACPQRQLAKPGHGTSSVRT
jgi:hypothetical protein